MLLQQNARSNRTAQRQIDLHPYQTELFTEVVRSYNRGNKAQLLVMPTGAGKTLLVQLLCRYALEAPNNINRVFVFVPQHTILDGFMRDHRDGVVYKGESGYLSNGVRPIRLQACSDIASVLQQAPSSSFGAHICCHQSASNPNSGNFDPFVTSGDLSNTLIVVDEAHHLWERNSLTHIIETGMSKGASVLLTTATPFHSKGELDLLHRHSFVHHVRTMGQHMAEGFAPKLRSVIENVPEIKSFEQMASCFLPRWNADGRPKCLVVIPTTVNTREFGSTEQHAELLIRAILDQDKTISCLNAIGRDAATAVSSECNGDTRHEITITNPGGRYSEGTDDKQLAAIYYFTSTSSPVSSIQMAGRTLRKKSVDYLPEQYREESLQVYFAQNRADDNDLARIVVQYIVRAEDPLGFELYSSLRKLTHAIRLHQDSTSPDGESTAPLDAILPTVQSQITQVLATVSDEDRMLLDHASREGITIQQLAQDVGSESTSVRAAALIAHVNAAVRNPELASSFGTLQLSLLSAQYADEQVVCGQSSLGHEEISAYYARWKQMRSVSDYEKANTVLNAWPDLTDSTVRGFFADLSIRYILTSVGCNISQAVCREALAYEVNGVSLEEILQDDNFPILNQYIRNRDIRHIIDIRRAAFAAVWISTFSRPPLPYGPGKDEQKAVKMLNSVRGAKAELGARPYIDAIFDALDVRRYFDAD